MQIPTPFLQLQHRACSDEFDVIRMGEKGKNRRHDSRLRQLLAASYYFAPNTSLSSLLRPPLSGEKLVS
jgi:hypothetical protein